MEIADQTVAYLIIGLIGLFIAQLIALFWKFHDTDVKMEKRHAEFQNELNLVNNELEQLRPIKMILTEIGTTQVEKIFRGQK
ncbi:hypothetical protein [Methanoregula sp.]|uniref:hypothetical protein n=1 Tax=Methanoregula sp. TaxID=2052170 RepID=UPI00356A8B72